MPEGPKVEATPVAPSGPRDRWKMPSSLARRLQVWVDVETVGPDGFYRWLATIVPLLPLPGAVERRGGADLEERIRELSRALATAAGDEARTHFEAATYFRDNQLLARRLAAIEAMLATQGKSVPARSPELDRAVKRYLPQERR